MFMNQDTQTPPRDDAAEGDRNLMQALNVGMSHFRAGRLAKAKVVFTDILGRYPGSGGALHFLGLIAHAEGDHDRAIQLLQEAIGKHGSLAFFHGNLGEVYRSLGRNSEAIASCRRALELIPVYPEALNTLGAALVELGELEEAHGNLRRAIEFKPDLAEAHANLGNLLRRQGQEERAVKAFQRALRHDPKLTGARLALGAVLRSLGRLEEVAATCREALENQPDDPQIWSLLGAIQRDLEQDAEAAKSFREVARLRPNLAGAHADLGVCLMALGDLEAALDSFRRAFRLRRTPSWDRPEAERRQARLATAADASFATTTPAKLQHDIEQFHYLVAKGRLPAALGEEIGRYEGVLQALGAAEPSNRAVPLTEVQRDKIADTYNKALYVAEAPAMESGAINPDLDVAAIELDYFAKAPGLTYFDGLLTPEALEALRRFCLESTLWFDSDSKEGYLGAELVDGFCCDLLLQVAKDLRQAFPHILGERNLRQMRAYKYGALPRADDYRSDAAAVRVDILITPDEANLNAETGGLVVYTREPTRDLDATDEGAVEAFLKENGSVTIAHRQNRAVMFDARLIHKTDTVRFKGGYENRRINVTMFFGRHGDAPKPL
jgi:tetratricopeptide (TPR) repeat protein